MGDTRMIPFVTLSEYANRAWITLSGCNFRCRGCFSIARDPVGTPMSPEAVTSLAETSARRTYGTDMLDETMVTGGEPTLAPEYLLRLVRSLRGISKRVSVQTNAFGLVPELTDGLIKAGMDELFVDIKAFDRNTHITYTGVPNDRVLVNVAYACLRTKMVAYTLLIPGLVESEEICKIAGFLAECRPVDLEYRIAPFRAELSPEGMSRTPDDSELASAVRAARGLYVRTIVSRSCLKEAGGGPSKNWVTVFPDGRMERRGLTDYRRRNRDRFGEGGGPR